jgi:polygalacturonase
MLTLLVSLLAGHADNEENATNAWAGLPKILARIIPPTFPDRAFDITHYGAKGDGVTDCTAAFRQAIDACHRAGGGKVMVPDGIFLTGAIHLQSNVDLHVAKDATIRFSTDLAHYLPVVFARYEGTEVMNYSPFIYAFEQTNIAVSGEGTIDGQGTNAVWHHWKSAHDPADLVAMGDHQVPVAQRLFGADHHLRPNFVAPVRCRNVLIEGVRLVNSPMWVLNPVYCTNVTIRHVTVDTQGPNTDGCDPDSCTDVLIQNCDFSDGDDCIAIKSGRDHDGQRIAIPCQNLVIQNCTFRAGHGGVAIGSETSGGVSDVFAENCRFDSPDLEMAMRFKTNPARGGYIKNVHIRNCTVKTARVGIHMTLKYASSGAVAGEAIPVIRDIDILDCTFENLTRQAVFIEGWSAANPISDVTIAGCDFAHPGKPSTVINATRIYFTGTHGVRLEQKTF